MNYVKVLLGATAIILIGSQANGQTLNTTGGGGDLMYMAEYKSTEAPAGYIAFCQRYGAECSSKSLRPATVVISQKKWDELNSVNLAVNRAVQPVTDLQLYGREDVWSFPEQYGDCEDYVLLKRKRLMEQGWPENALLITVLRDENMEGHAVLTVVTDMGDLILDNRVELIRSWADTPYTYYLRQSRKNPSKWVDLSADNLGVRATATILAGR